MSSPITHQSGRFRQADAAADGISFDGEADETALKPNPNIPGVPNWEIEELSGVKGGGGKRMMLVMLR